MNKLISKSWRNNFVRTGLILAYLGNGFFYIADIPYAIRIVLIILGVGLTLFGCYIWTKLKNRHWAFMFWGLLTPIGLLGISLLRDRSIHKEVEETS
ncbi:MAG: hypothetical protein PHG35_01525 [Dehalococcoidales bacterium]|nr:hypothetical protein [Dehalococcoidales bacterium]